jgi:hypothetical protein
MLPSGVQAVARLTLKRPHSRFVIVWCFALRRLVSIREKKNSANHLPTLFPH